MNGAEWPVSGNVEHIRLEFGAPKEKRFSRLVFRNCLDGLIFSVTIEKFQNVFQLSTADYSAFDCEDGT